ncbi:hypothetical protein ACOSP7_010817 [Xanthoceras sorbifolium]
MRGAKQQAQTAGPGEAYERHRNSACEQYRIRRLSIWARGPGDPGRRPRRSGQEAQADPGRRPRRIQGGDPDDIRGMTPIRSPGVRFREIRGDDPDEEPRCGSGRSGAMTPMRSPGMRFREIRGDDPDEEPRCGSGRSGG